jgi:hypothetical protein
MSVSGLHYNNDNNRVRRNQKMVLNIGNMKDIIEVCCNRIKDHDPV